MSHRAETRHGPGGQIPGPIALGTEPGRAAEEWSAENGTAVDDEFEPIDLDNLPVFDDEPLAPPPLDDTDAARAGIAKTNGAVVHASTFASKVLVGDAIEQLPPVEYLIDGLLVSDSLAVLYGPSGAYKSFLALDLAIHVALGADWQDRPVRQGTVLYVVAESANGVQLRTSAWKEYHHQASIGPVHWYPEPVQLRTAALDALIAYALDIGAVLIIFDTLAKCIVGIEENSARDMGLVVDRLEQLRARTGACVMPVHHTGIEGGRPRGSTALFGAVDTSLQATSRGPLQLKLENPKQKNDGQAPDLRLRLRTIGDSLVVCHRRDFTRLEDEHIDRNELRVLEALHELDDGTGVTNTVLEVSTDGLGRSTFYTARKRLLDRGLIGRIGSGPRAPFTLTEQGKQAIGE